MSAELRANLVACRRNCYRLQEGGRRLTQALRDITRLPVDRLPEAILIAEKALRHRTSEPDWKSTNLPEAAPHGWVFYGPDGQWHWSRDYDDHESLEDQRPATPAEESLAYVDPPPLYCSADGCHRNIASLGECGSNCRNTR